MKGKPKLIIDANELKSQIETLEAAHSFGNLGEMWAALANTSWAKSLTPRPLTAQVAMLRAKELGIMPKTKAGKRGGGLAGSTVVKQPRKVKLAKFAKEFAQMNVLYGEAKHLVEAAQGGSLKAAVKLKCLECSGFQRVEVKECACTVCPLYPFRPFQGT